MIFHVHVRIRHFSNILPEFRFHIVPKWFVTLSSSTGLIFVRPRIHPVGTESSWFRGDVYSRHVPAPPPHPSSTSWTVTKQCPREIFLMEPSCFAGLNSSHVLWKRFEPLVVTSATCLPVPERWSEGGFAKIDRASSENPTVHSSSLRVAPCWQKNDLRFAEQVLHNNPRSLRRHWAGWRKWLCETITLRSTSHRCGESITFLLLTFQRSSIHRTCRSKKDVRFL